MKRIYKKSLAIALALITVFNMTGCVQKPGNPQESENLRYRDNRRSRGNRRNPENPERAEGCSKRIMPPGSIPMYRNG